MPETPAPNTSVRWLARATSAEHGRIVALAACQALHGACSVAYALMLRSIVDAAVAGNASSFWRWSGVTALMVVTQLMLRAIVRWLDELVRARLENTLKARLFDALLRGDYGRVSAVHSAEWMNRLTSDAKIVADGCADIVPGFANMAVRLVGALAAVVWLDPRLAMVLIPGGVALAALTVVFRRVLRRLHKSIQEADGALRVFLQERLGALLTVRSYVAEAQAQEEASTLMDKHLDARMRRNRFANVCNVGFGAAMAGSQLAAAVWCAYGLLTRTMSFGTLTAIVQLVGQVQAPLANVSGYLPRWYAMLASADRLAEAEALSDDGAANRSAETLVAGAGHSVRALADDAGRSAGALADGTGHPMGASASGSVGDPAGALAKAKAFVDDGTNRPAEAKALVDGSKNHPLKGPANEIADCPTGIPSEAEVLIYDGTDRPARVLASGDAEARTSEEVAHLYENELVSMGLSNVSYTYWPATEDVAALSKDGMPTAVKNISIEVRKHEFVALAGHSGCGKSTALRLLMGAHHPDAGEVWMRLENGFRLPVDATWRRLFAYVPQGNQLLEGTIRDVIALGNPNAASDDARVWTALATACADKFVRKLPDGLDTRLGERGAGLSEGQMQRVSVARAVFSGAPILLLDEATSALDATTEAQLLANLRDLSGRTVIVAAHRPAALAACDRVLEFSQAGVAER